MEGDVYMIEDDSNSSRQSSGSFSKIPTHPSDIGGDNFEQDFTYERIEAEGIANYNRIINASLTSNILKQKGIDATLKLAESTNSKVVVIGSGKDGLPLILGNN